MGMSVQLYLHKRKWSYFLNPVYLPTPPTSDGLFRQWWKNGSFFLQLRAMSSGSTSITDGVHVTSVHHTLLLQGTYTSHMFQWQARRVCLLNLLKHLYGWCFLLCSSNKNTSGVYYVSVVAAHMADVPFCYIPATDTRDLSILSFSASGQCVS